jgi:hypothetical protein
MSEAAIRATRAFRLVPMLAICLIVLTALLKLGMGAGPML